MGGSEKGGDGVALQVMGLECWLGEELAQSLAQRIEPTYSLADWLRLTTFLAQYRRQHYLSRQ